MIPSTSCRIFAPLFLVCLLSLSASAQLTPGGDPGTGTVVDTTGQAAQTGQFGQGENIASPATLGNLTLDPDLLFGNVERDGRVGSSGLSGSGPQASGGGAGAGGFGGGGGAAAGGIGGLGGLGGFGSLFGGGNAGTGATQRPIRTKLRSAVGVAPRPTPQVQASANQRLQSVVVTPDNPNLRGVRVNVRDQTAVISGTVSSERDRRMSELLLRLEPGIRRVENRLIVSP